MKSTKLKIGQVAEALGLHINTVRRMADRGDIPFELSSGGHRFFDLVQVNHALGMMHIFETPHKEIWSKSFDLGGLEEDVVWREVRELLFAASHSNARDISGYVFTEMLNNAIDHSEGNRVHVSVRDGDESVQFVIKDDGCGVFKKLQSSLGLERTIDSIGELSKGKRTTAPVKHTGEGIFFSSKAATIFMLESTELAWRVDNELSDFTVMKSSVTTGTTVTVTVSKRTSRRLAEIFGEFTQDYEFVKTRPSVKLFETGLDFISRSEAKRLMQGLEKFEEIDLDFQKVEWVGQGFVDEVFRVWQSEHPDTVLGAINMNQEVEFMVERGRRTAE